MKAGSVVLAAFPQADGRYKLRPAVLLAFARPHDDLLLCAVSSQLHQAVSGLDEIVAEDAGDFADSGLRQTSLIRAGMLITLPLKQVPRELGCISAARLARLRDQVGRWIAHEAKPTTGGPSAAVSPSSQSLDNYLTGRVAMTDIALDQFIPSADTPPATIHKAMRHSVFAGGKRLRPILCLAAAEACGGSVEAAMPAACAVECLHTYSLIHDDLPCMDDDDLRRGVPTCHKVFGEGVAVLAGDALQALAFELVARTPANTRFNAGDYVLELAVTAGSRHLVGGQVADLEGEGKKLAMADLRYVHESKTAALLTTSILLGAMSAGASDAQIAALRKFGMATGLAFQVIDDILDVTQTSEKLGKSAGKDIAAEKSTFPSLIGLDASREEAKRLTAEAHEALQVFGTAGQRLRQLADYLLQRDY